jgi:putative FmdB family regulatory protein
MPTYDYICQACDHAFEEFQSITAPSLRKCPVCGKLKLKRLIGTGAGIIFKGSGFYETDYRSDNYKSGAKAESDKSSAKSETPKADSDKSATKSDTATPKSDDGAKSDAAGSANKAKKEAPHKGAKDAKKK